MIEQTVDIATPDGAMETFVCHPERGGPYPPVCRARHDLRT
jgi:carboxymethylenebutenolidase